MGRTWGVALLAAALTAGALAMPGGASADPGAPTGPPSVLLVHVADRADLGAVHSAARSGGDTVRHTFGSQHVVSVAVPAGETAAAAVRLARLPGVTAVERPVVRRFTDVSSTDVPDDPSYPRQRAYLDAVAASTAWTTEHGSPTVRIAVVDSGVDVGHPDLAGKIVGTYNANTGGTVVTDTVGHGTFVAGVAAAATGNGVGGAGAGYDSSVLAVKIADPSGDISVDDEIAGIRWAADHGADVINLSLSGPDPSSAEQAAVAYAQHRGALVVAAAGNDGDTVRQYPAAYPGVVAVGATDPVHRVRAAFSTYGAWVTLAAPGVGIWSTTPRTGSDYFPGTSGYAAADGTSFSAPLVAGEAALLKAKNPAMTVPALRAALVASAHGYARLGLGAGQVDFARALQHVTPSTVPTGLTTDGTGGVVRFTATSSAPRVQLRVDNDPPLAPAAVAHGRATVAWPSWGYPNGTHTLRAVDCTAYGECSTAARTVRFTLSGAAPALRSPRAGGTVSGRFTVIAAAPGGGGVRLLVDDHAYAFVARAPFLFFVDASALTDTHHTLRVQTCSVDGRRCAGPASGPSTVVSASLHPSVLSLLPSVFSPNHDGVRDAATLRFALPDAETVTVRVLDATGTTVAGAHLGRLAGGTHDWTWRGTAAGGRRLPDGRYTLAVDTTRPVAGVVRHGWAAHAAIVDTVAPTLSGTLGSHTRFYPVRDGYRDTFTPPTVVHGGGLLVLAIRTTTGRLVRVVAAPRATGRTKLAWDGRDRHGRVVAAGTYGWSYSITDAAGNTTRTARYSVMVSAKRLRTRTLSVEVPSARSLGAGATSSCASARHSGSRFSGGIRLANACDSTSGEFSYVQFDFAVPGAYAYSRLALQAYGRSGSRSAELQAAFQRSDFGVEVPQSHTVGPARTGWVTVSSVSAAGRMLPDHHVTLTLLLTSRYAGTNEFDLRSGRLQVTASVLA